MAAPGACSLGGRVTLWPNPRVTGSYRRRRTESSYDTSGGTAVPHQCSPGPAAPGADGGAGLLFWGFGLYCVAGPSGHRLLLLSTNRRLIRPLGRDRHSAPIFHGNCRARRPRRRRAPDFGLRPILCGRPLGPPAAIIVDEPKAHETARAGPSFRTSIPRQLPRQAPTAAPGSCFGASAYIVWPAPRATGCYYCRRTEGSYDRWGRALVKVRPRRWPQNTTCAGTLRKDVGVPI